MWNYEKRLEYPVNITTPNPKIAQIIMSQYGGRMERWAHPYGISLSVSQHRTEL